MLTNKSHTSSVAKRRWRLLLKVAFALILLLARQVGKSPRSASLGGQLFLHNSLCFVNRRHNDPSVSEEINDRFGRSANRIVLRCENPP